ncbi:hypothetical protein D8674_026832 [Pyrus ussuriensis x Pyrus communis]|uniref:Uncharacterized protein n=1 Tax=Pyrus ussuriensis x Pyrus communis TaxID=2448454 RepID=A0A5N5I914_9ROSA|nr:hypothetical protein D8674_026832 [Pyrus ussuriensis x Pyrus communis]
MGLVSSSSRGRDFVNRSCREVRGEGRGSGARLCGGCSVLSKVKAEKIRGLMDKVGDGRRGG